MPAIKSIVDASQLKKALSTLPAEPDEEGVRFKAIKGTRKKDKEPSGGIFIGTAMLKIFDKEKKDFTSAQVFEGAIKRSLKAPKNRLVLVSNAATEALKDVARACLRQAKLKYQFVALKPGEPEPDAVAAEDDGTADEKWATMKERQQERERTQPVDSDEEALRNQISARLPELLKATNDPQHGAEIQQEYARIAQRLKEGAKYWELLTLKEDWEQLDMLVAFAGATQPPSGAEEAVRLKTGAMGVKARLQETFPANLSDQLNKQVKRFIGGTGANFTPVIDALKAVEAGPTSPNLDVLEQAAQHYLDHVERTHSEKDKTDKTTPVKILAAQKALRDVEFARKALRVRQEQATLGPLPWDEEKTAKARDLDAQMEELGSKDKAAAAQQEFEHAGGKTALEEALRHAGQPMPPEYATLTWGQRAAMLAAFANAQPNFERAYKSLEPKFFKLRKQDPAAHILLDQADVIYKSTRANGKFVEGKQQLERFGVTIGERLTELERNPVATPDLTNAARHRLDQLQNELVGLEDGAEARQIGATLDRDIHGLQGDETGAKALDLTQRALEKVETLRRRAAVLLNTYRKEQTATVRIFEELVGKDAQRANGVKAEFQHAVAVAIALGERKDYRAAIADFDRIQARLRAILDARAWEEKIGGDGDLKGRELKLLAAGSSGAAFSIEGTAVPLVAKLNHMPPGLEDLEEMLAAELRREAELYEEIGEHPNIARCLGLRPLTVPGKGTQTGLVLERLSGDIGSAQTRLKQRLANNEITSSEYWGTVQHTLASMLQGLDHMASRDIIHCDIKENNVMYDAETGEVKLIDIGGVGRTEKKPDASSGSGYNQSPERRKAQDNPTRENLAKVTGKIDVFALGGMLHRFGEEGSFDAKDDMRLKPIKRSPDDPEPQVGPGRYGAETEYVKFVNWLLNDEPDERPTAREALEHPFLKDRLLGEDEARQAMKQLHTDAAPTPLPDLIRAATVERDLMARLQERGEQALAEGQPDDVLIAIRDELLKRLPVIERLASGLLSAGDRGDSARFPLNNAATAAQGLALNLRTEITRRKYPKKAKKAEVPETVEENS